MSPLLVQALCDISFLLSWVVFFFFRARVRVCINICMKKHK